jgi:hypothetical protein
MIAKILEMITGKDDVERVACKEDLILLNEYLKTRKLLIPKRPKRFLDAATFTPEHLLELTEEEAKDLAGDHFEPWILVVDGRKRLPAFSSRKKLEAFSAKISQQLNKVFGLGSIESLLADITKHVDVDFVDLNLFSIRSWEIGVNGPIIG